MSSACQMTIYLEESGFFVPVSMSVVSTPQGPAVWFRSIPAGDAGQKLSAEALDRFFSVLEKVGVSVKEKNLYGERVGGTCIIRRVNNFFLFVRGTLQADVATVSLRY